VITARKVERSKQSGAELGLDPRRVYEDYKEMAVREARRKDGIEAVAIVTPNHLHYRSREHVIAALRGRKTLTVVDRRRYCSRDESAVLIEIEACRIGLACVYCHALGAVQGRTAWSRRTEGLHRAAGVWATPAGSDAALSARSRGRSASSGYSPSRSRRAGAAAAAFV